MPRPDPALSTLTIRKQLLVTEAELYRQEMVEDFRVVADSLDEVGHKLRTVGTVASAAAILIGGLAAWRGVRAQPPAPKPSSNGHNGHPTWLSRLVNGTRIASSLWQGWQSVRR